MDPSEKIREEGYERKGGRIRAEGSELRDPSGLNRAEGFEWRDPSGGIRVEGSERRDPSRRIRVEGPSGGIREKDSE